MKPIEPPMYHYKIVFKNGQSLNVLSSAPVFADNLPKWVQFGLEDARNGPGWFGVRKVIVRTSSIMYIALLSVDQPCPEDPDTDTQNI